MEPSASAAAAALHGRWPMFGRDAVVERAVAALEHDARSVFVYGPSGIGKSRLAAAVGARLEESGRLILTAAGNSALTAVPFAAFAPAIARGVPASGLPAATEPLALFTVANAAISDLAQGRGVVLVVDDLSAVDTVSITLITQLVGAERMQLIATIQEGEPVPDAALPLAAGAESLRIDVAPLDIDELDELLATVLSGRMAHRDVVEIHAASHGNPLFVREFVLGAIESGSLMRTDEHWRLTRGPEGTPALRDLIRYRMRGLGPSERDVVERLAVCQPLSLDEFMRPGAPEALAELEIRGMVKVEESGLDIVVALAHPHYAAAVREAMPRMRSIAILIEQADVVAGRTTMNAADELRVALWRLDAGKPSDVALLLRAAGLAHTASDHRTAVRLTTAAIECGADDAGTHLLHAELMWALGRGDEAVVALERADRSAEREETPKALVAAIAAKRAEVYGGDPLGSERGIRLLDEVAAVAPEQRAQILLAKAGLTMQLLRAHETLALVDEAAELLGDHPSARGAIALARATPLAFLQREDEALEAAQFAVARSADPDAGFSVRQATMVLASVLLEADHYVPAREAVIASLHQAIRDDDQLTTRMNEFLMGRIFWLMGRLDTAARWLRDTVSGAELHGPRSLRSPSLGLHAIVACEQGDLATAKTLRARMDEGYDSDDSITALAEAWIAHLSGDTDAAAAILLAGAEQVVPRGAFGTAATLLHTLARIGSPRHAANAAARLEAIVALAPGRRVRMLLRHARAEADADAAALRIAGAEWEQLGGLLYAAECFASAGRAHRAAGAEREASADLQRAAALTAACEGARTPLLRFTSGAEPLTIREREVASLAAQGLTSNDIAQRLYLSPRTVNNHLQSTYTKLGIRGRHELSI